MVEIVGSIQSSSLQNGKEVFVFRIPALSSSIAKRRAIASGRLKGLNQPEATEIEVEGEGSLPGQKIYLVKVTGRR